MFCINCSATSLEGTSTIADQVITRAKQCGCHGYCCSARLIESISLVLDPARSICRLIHKRPSYAGLHTPRSMLLSKQPDLLHSSNNYVLQGQMEHMTSAEPVHTYKHDGSKRHFLEKCAKGSSMTKEKGIGSDGAGNFKSLSRVSLEAVKTKTCARGSMSPCRMTYPMWTHTELEQRSLSTMIFACLHEYLPQPNVHVYTLSLQPWISPSHPGEQSIT
eukprot:363278-Chlamydomonas_euryale.AAC.5